MTLAENYPADVLACVMNILSTHDTPRAINALLDPRDGDRAELAKLLNISANQMSYITSAEAGHGLIRVGGSIVPFANEFPRDTELYRLMTTTPGDK